MCACARGQVHSQHYPLRTAPTQPAGQQEPQAREAGLLQMYFFSLLSLLSIAGDVNKGSAAWPPTSVSYIESRLSLLRWARKRASSVPGCWPIDKLAVLWGAMLVWWSTDQPTHQCATRVGDSVKTRGAGFPTSFLQPLDTEDIILVSVLMRCGSLRSFDFALCDNSNF